MTWVKDFLDGIGSMILWIDFAVQGIGVILRFVFFTVVSKLFPFCGKRDFDWKLKPPSVPSWSFALLWLGGVFALFWSISIWALVVVLILEFFWGLYALVNGKGERRREIFFNTLGIHLVTLILFLTFVLESGLTSWREVNVCRHHGSLEAWILVAFFVLRAGLFPFHAYRIDYLVELPISLSLAHTVFNSWILFQTGLFIKTVGFLDAFGDWSALIMTWVIVSALFGVGLSAVQERSKRMWAHLFWMLGHLALYVTLL